MAANLAGIETRKHWRSFADSPVINEKVGFTLTIQLITSPSEYYFCTLLVNRISVTSRDPFKTLEIGSFSQSILFECISRFW
jgi:hypothetical protein